MAKRITVSDARGNLEEADRRGQSEWRREARENQLLYNGYQWPDGDIRKMEKEGRPNVSFNRIAPLVDAMVGMELANRKEVKFYPRTAQGNIESDMMNAVASWVRQESGQEVAEIDAEKDMFITGIGCTDTRMNYEDSELGDLDIERVNPMDVRWDPNATKRNLLDAKWVARYKVMTTEEIKEIWPDIKLEGISEEELKDNPYREKVAYNPATYDRFDAATEGGKKGHKVWQYQYWCLEPYWKVENPFTKVEPEFFAYIQQDLIQTFGEQVMQPQMNLTEDGFNKLKKMAKDLQISDYKSVRLNKKIYYKLIFTGQTELQHEENAVHGHFTQKFITGKRDEKDGCWYGMVRSVRDPQLWANKFLSTLLFIYMHNSKGGIMVESDAVPNQEEFRREWARPDGIMTLNPGAVANGKIKEKPKSQIDAASAQIMQYAIDAIPATSGIDPAVVAMSTQNRSNALETTRIRQTSTVLMDYFESMTQYRKDWGKMLVQFTKDYLSQEDRLIRLTDAGNTVPQFVQLMSDQLADDYDVIAEEGAMTINQKAETWQILSQLFQGQGIPLPLWKYAPIPSNIANEIMETLGQQQDAQAQQAQQITDAQAQEIQTSAAKNAALANNAEARTAQIQSEIGMNQMQAALNAFAPAVINNDGELNDGNFTP